MKIQNQLLALAISSVLSQAAMADGACNGTDGLNGWGIWCTDGAQPAPAAGPATPTADLQNIPADIADLDDFGGNPEPEDNALPIAVASNTVYYRAAYNVEETSSGTRSSIYNSEGGYSYPAEDNFDAEGNTTSTHGIGTATISLSDDSPEIGDRIEGSFADRNGAEIASFDYFDAEGSDGEDGRYEYNYATVDTSSPDTDEYDGSQSQGTYQETSDDDGVINTFSYEHSRTYSYIDGSQALASLENYWTGSSETGDYEYQYSSVYNTDTGELQAEYSDSSGAIEHGFVGGTLTSAEFIAQQVSNQTVAGTYTGESNFHQQDVNITVNFTEQSFEGNWTGGDDFNGVASHDFVAEGNLVGQHIVATSITGDAVSGGTLQGSFFGDSAQALAGAYEVNSNTGTFNDVFSTVEEGTTSFGNDEMHYKDM